MPPRVVFLSVVWLAAGAGAALPCDPPLGVPEAKVNGTEGTLFLDPTTGRRMVCVCHLRPCFLKCCPEGEAAFGGRNCSPVAASEGFDLASLLRGDLPRDYELLTGFPRCLTYKDTDGHRLLPNGSLYLDHDAQVLPPGQFCLEHFYPENRTDAIVCFPEEDEFQPELRAQEIRFKVYPFGMFISIPFLVATFLAYALLPQRQNLHGMSFMSHIFSLILGYTALATIQFFSRDLSAVACIVFAYVMQFAFLATFFWLNVMCFDIWWAFSSLKKPGGSARDRDRTKFTMYSLYAWGLPSAILTVTLLMDYTDWLRPNHPLRPRIGQSKCFFEGPEATWAYLYGPMAVIIITNLIMFAITANRIFIHSKETKVLKSEDSRRHDSKDRERFNLYLKLFIVMGVNWVAELISWAFKSPNYLWYFTDVTNTLQGVIIFVIFVCKRRVLRLLEQRLCPSRVAKRSTLNSSNRSRITASTSAGTKDTNGSARAFESLKLKDYPEADTNV